MTLRKFNTDLSSASQKIAAGAVPGVESIAKGESEGELVIRYRNQLLHRNRVVPIRALAQNVDEYPDGNTFMLFTEDEDAPELVDRVINRVQDYLFGMRVYEMVTELASHFKATLNGGMGDKTDGVASNDSQGADSPGENNSDDEGEYGQDSSLDDDAFGLATSKPVFQKTSPQSSAERSRIRQRLRRDLRQAKQAGYKVGLFNDIRHTGTQGIISISIRAQKLGLSEEAREAWDVEEDDYIVLLIRFEAYAPVERVVEQASEFTRVQFRIGKCTRYKPLFKEALAAFAESNGHASSPEGAQEEHRAEESTTEDAFRKLFISNSLNQYLNECFVALLKLRAARKCSWDEANVELDSKTKGTYQPPGSSIADPMDLDPSPEDHRILASDHLAQNAPEHGHSLPLVAMEFAMHYFVRCTEYCLCCHQKVDKGFEALRPYVCSKPLCLFQYMAMGFGPNIEHEILTEPYVVDLLVSLCYAALERPTTAYSGSMPTAVSQLSIRELPVGLPMKVPNLFELGKEPLKAFWLKSEDLLTLDTLPPSAMDGRLSIGTWIAFRYPAENTIKHAAVVDFDPSRKSLKIKTIGDSLVTMSPGVYMAGGSWTPQAALNGKDMVHIYFYDTDLDSLSEFQKAATLRHILDTLPPIMDIAAFLTSHPHASVRAMDGISAAAASALQWVVSSNRSCIFQVDSFDDIQQRGQPSEDKPQPPDLANLSKRRKNRAQERIPGMPGWIQFRFAQGSPDKELRFKRALQEVAARKAIHQTPTIFAWHGSSLCNWHSIVRNGLDFNQVANGRAYGNGVYFSPHYQTSVGYAQRSSTVWWPNSALKITTCLSLNEIINAPDEFVSRTPHYVVSQLDWHQCRYLFAQAGWAKETLPAKEDPLAVQQQRFHTQAPGLQIADSSGKAMRIPLAAIPFRHVGAGSEAAQPLSTKRTSVRREEDESAEEEPEDVDFLFSEGESDETRAPPNKKPMAHERPITPASTDTFTDFQPGALDIAQLHTMRPPTFATDMATKALGRELSSLQKVQSRTPIHELGWYMDFDKMENIFHWIVEFHSFDPSLPLAHDMKKVGVTSVVFEVRFGKNFPMAPPFVRVIRPRFLPFMEGGGGHVTAGGAMCMELLTNSGWSPANSMESVFLQVRMALCALEPKPARLEEAVKPPHPGTTTSSYGQHCRSYGVSEAIDAYIRAARTHGWAVPADLHQTANGI
ncbi:hypothetical protein QBC37DRAFT_346453 [Rhypophila decipiens]|uniref:UBC core domain-containing protein n=1 Tax=Rhypophila decipiens TaxID=261697 RepID=A0AAN7B618_9PEZI|nr:hypothetical protein QBC37DRAFT_346453 [Rhypophila decipiens]